MQKGLRRPYKELRREAKGKGEKERYTHLNAEFQRIARRDKKADPEGSGGEGGGRGDRDGEYMCIHG